MSELPDLPRPPRQTVAAHPAGVGGAIGRGRRRRAGLAAGLGAVVALVATGALLLPSGAGERGDTLFAGESTAGAPPRNAPVLVEASSAEICVSAEDCRTVTGDAALTLSRALGSARRAPSDAPYCRAIGPTYRVRLSTPGAATQELVVRSLCGPMSIGDEDFLLDQAVASRVARAHETGTVEPPVVGRDVAEVRLCRTDRPGDTACTVIDAREELHLFSDLVSAGGPRDAVAGECTGVDQDAVTAILRFDSGATATLSAGTRCGPLATGSGDHALVPAARERYFRVPTPGRQVAGAASESASPVSSSSAQPSPVPAGTVTCVWEPTETGAQEPGARRVGPPSTSAPRRDRAATIVTNRGEIGLTLTGTATPCTVHNFVHLASKGFYDDTRCHRLTTEGIFVVQCGDPRATGVGGPGYAFADEDLRGATYPRGTLAMANAGAGTNGSQFFMVYRDMELPPAYTVFGRVDEAGLAVLEEVAAGGAEPEGDGTPTLPLTITGMRVS